MTPEEYARLDGLGLADLVRRKQVTASDLVEIAIAAIETLDPKLNAVPIRAFDLPLGLRGTAFQARVWM